MFHLRLTVKGFGLLFGLMAVMLSTSGFAQVLDDPTKKKDDPTKQDPTKSDPTKQDPTKSDPTKVDEKPKVVDDGNRLIEATGEKKPIGLNTEIPITTAPETITKGVFSGLEVYGYKIFKPARDTIAARASMKKEATTSQGTLSSLTTVVGPNQVSFVDVSLPAPDRYQLGPGDKLILRYYSPYREVQDKATQVDAVGNIFVPIMGSKLTVRGMTLLQAEAAIKKELRRALKDAEVSLTLSELRAISVNIAGEVVVPGNYSLPSIMTLFNALVAAGGPTIDGTMRNIQLRRANGKPINIDLYRYFQGDSSQDIPLQPGDFIYVPLSEKRVAVKGAVGREAVYELKGGERLSDVVKLAGGYKPSAILERVEVASVLPDVERQLLNVNFKQNENPILKNEDVVTFYELRPEIENIVTLEGAVDQPRAYQFYKGMRVADAIMQARGVLREAYLERADLVRQNEDRTTTLIPINLRLALQNDPKNNLPLERFDRLRVYGTKEVEWLENRFVDLKGAVRKPGRYTRMLGMRLSDLILQAGGLLPEASVETIFVFRKNSDGTEGKLDRVDGGKALFQNDTTANVQLEDRDTIQVYTKAEAKYIEKQVFSVEGAVQKPGSFTRSENVSLKDAIELAGGYLPTASISKVFIFRKNADGTEGPLLQVQGNQLANQSEIARVSIQDRDQVVVYTKDELEYRPKQEFKVLGSVLKTGTFPRSEGLTLQDAINLSGGLKPEAGKTVVVSHARVQSGTPNEIYQVVDVLSGKVNPPIQDGDVVSIPADSAFQENPILVEVKGRVKNPGVYAVTRKSVTLNELIKIAGGLAEDAWAVGATFSRDPKLLRSEAVLRLAPQVKTILDQVQQQQYKRALAKSDIDKIRLLGANLSSALTSAAALTNPLGASAISNQVGTDSAVSFQPQGQNRGAEKVLSRDTVTEARPTTIEDLGGNLPVRLDEAIRNPKSQNNIILRDGDIINVPETPSTVAVAGAVFVPSNQLFEKSKTLKYYIDRVGGLTIDADKDQILVIKPTGTVVRGNNFTKIELGDTILVPTKVMVANLTDGQQVFESVVRQITNTGLLFAVFRALINR